MASSRVRPIATSLQMDAPVRDSPRSYARLGARFAGFPLTPGRADLDRRPSVQDRGALGELEVEGRRGQHRIRLDVGDLGHAGHLVADGLDEPGDDAVE